MNVSEWLKVAGPFTAPLCAGMGAVIAWLLRELKRSQSRERKTTAMNVELLERRGVELLESAKMLAESGRVIREALQGHDRQIERMLEKKP